MYNFHPDQKLMTTVSHFLGSYRQQNEHFFSLFNLLYTHKHTMNPLYCQDGKFTEETSLLKSFQEVIMKIENMLRPKKNAECHNYTADCNIRTCPFTNSGTLPECTK